MSVQNQPMTKSSTPVVIYAPGLGAGEANSADRIADVVAKVADTLDRTKQYNTKSRSDVAAPPGLTVSKTVVDASSDRPVLQFFQFDYAAALKAPRDAAVPGVVPGLVRSTTLAVWAALKWFRAVTEDSKTARTKLQLALGLFAAMALVFVALLAMYALLVALGLDLPWLEGALGTEEQAATWVFGVASLGLTITWASLRKKVLAAAEIAEEMIRFTTNNGQIADTISFRLDQAIDRMADEWDGPVHLLGYSFGSLILFEAMHPRTDSGLSAIPVETVSSLVTIGCPLDVVRLYEPSYVEERRPRRKGLAWKNVFNEADIFASNLKDKSDGDAQGTPMKVGGMEVSATSFRHTNEKISLFQIFVSGRTHTSYWKGATEASCFDRLVGGWITSPDSKSPDG